MTEKNENNISNKQLLIQYAGLGAQLLAYLIIAVFAGKWIDDKLKWNFPFFIWLLPLLVIIVMILKAVRDTSKKKNG